MCYRSIKRWVRDAEFKVHSCRKGQQEKVIFWRLWRQWLWLFEAALFLSYPHIRGMWIVVCYADGDCSHEIKRRLLLGRKAMTNLDSIFKSRDITLPTKVHIVKAMVFPVVMYGCESWTIKKAEHQKIDAFKLRCWRRLLRVLWTARRSNQSIPKEINLEYALEGLMLEAPILWPPDSKSWLIGKRL